jgi:hypothetical protein
MAEPLVFQARNHPNQIVYFSPLMGGPKSAFARYDMDYWGKQRAAGGVSGPIGSRVPRASHSSCRETRSRPLMRMPHATDR